MSTTTESNFNIVTTVEISEQRIRDTLCTAFEGGIGYWARCPEYGYTVASPAEWPVVSYYYEHAVHPQGYVTIEDIEDDEDGKKPRYRLDRESIAVGLRIMAADYPRHFADLVNENDDADTGDAFVQCCVFGEVIYG
jgi:hypothetical protein